MDKYEKLKLECLRIARISWRTNQHPPFVVGFKNGEIFPIPMPSFIHSQDMLVTFIEVVSSEVSLDGDWEATALFHQVGKGNMTITLIGPEKMMTTEADIVDDYGGVYLSDFSEWQDLGNSNITLSHCLSRDVGNAIQRRMENYG